MIPRFWDSVLSAGLRRPKSFLLGAAAVMALLGTFLALRLELRTDLSEMLPTRSARILERIDRAFGSGRRAFILLARDEPGEEPLVRAAEALEERLLRSPDIESARHGWAEEAERTLSALSLPWGPLFARAEDLPALERKLTREGIEEAVGRMAARMRLPGLGPLESLAAADPLEMRDHLLARFASMRGAFRFHPGSLHALSEDARSLLITLAVRPAPQDIAGAKRVAAAVREAAREVLAGPEAGSIRLHATGGPFLAAESEEVIRGDLTSSNIGAVVLVALITLATLRRLLPTLLGVAALALGMLAGLAATALLFGTLDALALGAGAILVGLGIDFVAHLSSGTLVAAGAGMSPEEAARSALRESEPGMRYAALSAAAGFLAFTLARQDFLRQMGVLAAAGILGTYLATLAVYPLLLVLLLRRSRRPVRPPRDFGIRALGTFSASRPRTVLGVALALGAASLALLILRPPELETDLRNIHARGSPALEAQERIREAFGSPAEPLALLLDGKTEDEAVEAARRLAGPLDELLARGETAGWVSIAQLVPSPREQEAVIELLSRKRGAELSAALRAALDRHGFDPEAFAASIRGLEALDGVRTPLGASRLREAGLASWVDEILRREGESPSAPYLTLAVVYPRVDLWTSQARTATVNAVEEAARRAGVNAEPAGLYTVSDESAREVAQDFSRISLAAAAAVALLVAIQFRSIGWTLVVLLPLALACLWMGAAFDLVGWKLNFMNITVLPMVVGTGVDSGLHVVSRFLRAGRGAREAARSALLGVMLSAATSIAGFGSLALSRNRGLSSVGWTSVIGTACCLLAASTALPAVLSLVEARRRGYHAAVDSPGRERAGAG